MRIIGCDLHARQQSVAMLDLDTGEIQEHTLTHEGNQVREFYASLPRPMRVGIEATGSMRWFLELMEEVGAECLVGHPAQIRASEPRRQKHDRRDAQLLLKLLVEDRFPQIWMPSLELRELRALLLHRQQWVRMRVRLQNGLQAIALAHGLRLGARLWSRAGQAAVAALPLAPCEAARRDDLLRLRAQLQTEIERLDRQLERECLSRPQARRLATHPGVGPVIALATEAWLGDPARFENGKAVASYVGMIPSEYSSGGQQRCGSLSKQGNSLLRTLWCEAVIHAVLKDEELKRFFRRKLAQKGLGKARVAAARKVGIRLWVMLRDQIDYDEFCRRRRQHGEAQCGQA